MIKDIVVNLGLGAKDPAGDYAVALGEALKRMWQASPLPMSRSSRVR